jgi:acetolactate synthase I/II/III large subunit
MSNPSVRSAGKILVDALLGHGVRHAFCVPGESYLPVIDAAYDARDRLTLVVCRQEGGAAYMAEAYAKTTGQPGVCFVTRGPGATNASVGVHTAQQDSSPMILFVGQVGSDVAEREAFQEIDYRRMFGSMVKWAAQIDRADRIPEMVSHAFHCATAGRPGPVVLALPEDMLCDAAAVADTPHYHTVRAHPGAAQMSALRDMLAGASRPLLLLGGGGWSARACDDIRRFAEHMHLPVACAFRSQDLFDNAHPQYAGDVGIGINPRLAARVRETDLLIVVGARLGEQTTSTYSLIRPPCPDQPLVHVHAGAEELGRVYHARLPINAGMAEFAAAAAALAAVENPRWAAWTRAANADYLAGLVAEAPPGTLDMVAVMRTLHDRMPRDTIVTNGAGNYSGWVQRFWRYGGFRTQLAPTNGSMGYGVPAAIAAKLACPDRAVLSFSGDGCFLMNGQELATAVKHRLRILFFVVNNDMYGTIRMHQERDFPARVYATELANPDFAALARAYGMHGETVAATADFAPALERALAHAGPALIELKLAPEAITTRATLSAIRAQALAARQS